MTILATKHALLPLALFALNVALVLNPSIAWAGQAEPTAVEFGGSHLMAQRIDLEVLDVPNPYETSDGLVVIEGAQSGSVSYSAKTKTLMLKNVKASRLSILKGETLTLKLVGKNMLQVEDGSSNHASLVISGKGSLEGTVHVNGDLMIEGGNLKSKDMNEKSANAISCSKFVMKGGTVEARGESSGDACGISCDNLVIKDGKIQATSATTKGNRYGIKCVGDFVMTGGEVIAKGVDDLESEGGRGFYKISGFGVMCKSLEMSGGALTADGAGMGLADAGIVCEEFALHGGTVSAIGEGEDCDEGFGIRCSDAIITGGTLDVLCDDYGGNIEGAKNEGIHCSRSFKMSGGEAVVYARVKCGDVWGYDGTGISCERFTLLGGNLDLTGIGSPDDEDLGGGIGRGLSCSSFKMLKGTMKATGQGRDFRNSYGIDCAGDFTLKGGKLTAIGGDSCQYASGYGVKCASLKMSGGTLEAVGADVVGYGVACDSLTVSGGTLKASGKGLYEEYDEYAVIYGISCAGKLTMMGGKVLVHGVEGKTDNLNKASISCATLLVKGGSISLTGNEGTGVLCKAFTLSKGTVSVTNQKGGAGVNVKGGNLKMTGGTLSVTKCQVSAIYLNRGKDTKGGKATITGGKVTARTLNPTKKFAIGAKSISYKAKCLKSIRGQMPPGFTFKYKGNTYKVRDFVSVKLVKYGKGKVRYKTVVYGGHKYDVD